jgi:hypothetical protein
MMVAVTVKITEVMLAPQPLCKVLWAGPPPRPALNKASIMVSPVAVAVRRDFFTRCQKASGRCSKVTQDDGNLKNIGENRPCRRDPRRKARPWGGGGTFRMEAALLSVPKKPSPAGGLRPLGPFWPRREGTVPPAPEKHDLRRAQPGFETFQKKLSPHDLPPHKVRISKQNMWNRCHIGQPKANPQALLKKLMSYGLGLCGLSFV